MNRSSFCDALCVELSRTVSDGSSVTRKQIQKNNGVILDAICIQYPSSDCSPVVYVDSLYEEFLAGKTVERIARSLLKEIRRDMPVSEGLFAKIRNFEIAKDMLSFRLISKDHNEDILSDIPWISFLDLAVIFYLQLDVTKDKTVSVCVNHELMQTWNQTTETLWELASQNTPRLLPAVNHRLDDLLSGYFEEERVIPASKTVPDLYVLTNEPGVYGASCILYDHVLNDFSGQLDSDLIILPSSIHEVLLLADSPELNYSNLYNTVHKVNMEAVPPEDLLSDKIYRYTRENRSVTVLGSDVHGMPMTDGTMNP